MRQVGIGLMLLAFALSVQAGENDWLIRASRDKAEDPPKTINAAESMTGNSAPVVPQRQSERKKPPEPDYLLGKVIWGESATFTDPEHGKMEVDDWNLVPEDVTKFIAKGREVGQDYHWTNVHLEEFSYNPDDIPVLFFSGARSLKLNESQMNALRQYVTKGGMVVLDSVYGSPHFTNSARQTFTQMFPGKTFRRLPVDHPLLHIYHDIEEFNYPEEPGKEKPHLEGMYVGARAGVLLAPYGMGTGLAGKQWVFEELKERGLEPKYIDPFTAEKLATNIVGYAVGYAEVGKIQGRAEEYAEADKERPTDEFVFAQIQHDGAWNTHPGAASSLLQKLRHQVSISTHMRRVAVDLEKDDLSLYPFLYLTGLDTFAFSDVERRAIREYVANGGFLLVNNGLGLSRFHQAATSELKKIFPDAEMKQLDPEHEMMSILMPIDKVNYTPTLQQSKPELENKPLLFGVEVEGDIAAVYSPYDLEAGWLNTDFPQMRGYQNQSAQRLGMNIVAYSLMR